MKKMRIGKKGMKANMRILVMKVRKMNMKMLGMKKMRITITIEGEEAEEEDLHRVAEEPRLAVREITRDGDLLAWILKSNAALQEWEEKELPEHMAGNFMNE
jgi:hypothetical protein